MSNEKEVQSFEEYKVIRLKEIEETKTAEGKEFKEKSELWKVGRDYLKMVLHVEGEVKDSVPADILAAILALVPVRKVGQGGGSGKPNVKAIIREALFAKFREDGIISESQAFMLSMGLGQGWGRVEMKNLIRRQIEWVKPEERMWIQYVAGETEGTYELVAEGEETPADWDGPVPKVNEMDDLV